MSTDDRWCPRCGVGAEWCRCAQQEKLHYERAHNGQPCPDRCLTCRVFASRVQFDFRAHLHRQFEFSARAFGPPGEGATTTGVIDHIRKELREIEADPSDLSEWMDLVILGLDGAWRAGYTSQQIIDALMAKQTKNEARTWPDWRTAPRDKAIEHDRGEEAA